MLKIAEASPKVMVILPRGFMFPLFMFQKFTLRELFLKRLCDKERFKHALLCQNKLIAACTLTNKTV